MIEWLAMGGYGSFVWGSYGVTVLAIGAELLLLARRRCRAFRRARAEAEARNGN